jgi:hypothetical protein
MKANPTNVSDESSPHAPTGSQVLLTSVHASSVRLLFMAATAPPPACKRYEQDHSEQKSLTSKVEEGAVLLDVGARAHVR